MILELCMVNINTNGGTAGQLIEPHNSGARELHVPPNQSKVTTFSPSSFILSPFDEDFMPSYFFGPILQEVMRPVLQQTGSPTKPMRQEVGPTEGVRCIL